MMGYLRLDSSGGFIPLKDGWYNTGDIVDIDSDGFVWIKGRSGRFAKIAGEMVSLVALEEVAAALWPGLVQTIIALLDDRKGEKLVLVTENPAPNLEVLKIALKATGFSKLAFPRKFIYLPKIPLTALGKVSLSELMEVVEVVKSPEEFL